MSWPKGVSRTGKNGAPMRNDGEAPEVRVSVEPRRKVNLTSTQFDPFTKFKTDEKHFHYRALNMKPDNLNVREAEGYDYRFHNGAARFGDLILARIPRELHEENRSDVRGKTERQTEAAVNQFKEDAARHGVEVFEERD